MDTPTGRARGRSQTIRQQWRDAVRDSPNPAIDALTVAVAMALDRHMSGDGATYTSVRELGRLARVSKNTAVDRIGRLEAAGLLVVDRPGRGASSRYRAVITDPNCPTLWDTLDPVDNPNVSHPMGHSPNGSVPPGGQKVSHPVTKVSHPVGPTPYDPVDMTPSVESARVPHPHPAERAHAPLLENDPITIDHLAGAYAQHLTGRGRANPDEIRDEIRAALTRSNAAGPQSAIVDLACRLDDLPPDHTRRWARELTADLYPTTPAPWT